MVENEGEQKGEEGRTTVEVEAAELDELKQQVASMATQLQGVQLENARLEERAKAPAGQAPAEQSPPTREQMQTWVDEGQITQAQMDGELARQDRVAMKAEMKAEVTASVDEKRQADTIQEEFNAYVEAFPAVNVDGSPEQKRVYDEIAALKKLGLAHDLRTEVLAMRRVHGDLDRVQETTRLRREVHEETQGAGAGGDDAAAAATETWATGLTEAQIKTFRHQLSVNAYKGEDDPMFQRVCTRARTQNKEKRAA